MKLSPRFFFLLIPFFALAACSSSGGGLSPEEINATAAEAAATIIVQTMAALPPSPTAISLPPTEMPTVSESPTATSEALLFRDDFDGTLSPEWSWQNETPDRWTITEDGFLQITGDDLSLLYSGAQNNLLLLAIPSGDFELRTLVSVEPTSNFQQAAILLYGDANNYAMVSRAFCTAPKCGTAGGGVFLEYKRAGVWEFFAQPVTEGEIWLRLVSQGNTLTGYFAVEEDNWIELGRIDSFFTFTQIGLGASNVDTSGVAEDVVARFDYFEVRRP